MTLQYPSEKRNYSTLDCNNKKSAIVIAVFKCKKKSVKSCLWCVEWNEALTVRGSSGPRIVMQSMLICIVLDADPTAEPSEKLNSIGCIECSADLEQKTVNWKLFYVFLCLYNSLQVKLNNWLTLLKLLLNKMS